MKAGVVRAERFLGRTGGLAQGFLKDQEDEAMRQDHMQIFLVVSDFLQMPQS